MEKRTKDNPWKLKTPPQTSEYEMYVDHEGREGNHRLHRWHNRIALRLSLLSQTCMRC